MLVYHALSCSVLFILVLDFIYNQLNVLSWQILNKKSLRKVTCLIMKIAQLLHQLKCQLLYGGRHTFKWCSLFGKQYHDVGGMYVLVIFSYNHCLTFNASIEAPAARISSNSIQYKVTWWYNWYLYEENNCWAIGYCGHTVAHGAMIDCVFIMTDLSGRSTRKEVKCSEGLTNIGVLVQRKINRKLEALFIEVKMLRMVILWYWFWD